MSDWIGEYSMILHSIEDKIDKISSPNSSRKRIRTIVDSPMNGEFDNSINSNTMKLSLQLDESRLLTEELSDKLKYQADEFAREKDRYARQLQFMESECHKLKSELNEKTEKYYNVKKKMQLVIRTAESEKEEMKKLIKNSTTKVADTSTNSNSINDNFHESWMNRLKALESSVFEKSEEVKRLSQRNYELEEQCGILQQNLVKAMSSEEVNRENNENNIGYVNMKKYLELESSYKQKLRENDKLKLQLKNQIMLKEEIDSSNKKISRLENEIKILNEVQISYNILKQECDNWNDTFKNIISLSSSNMASEHRNISVPVQALRFLSEMQGKCTALLTEQSQLESEIRESKSLCHTLESKCKSLESNCDHLTRLLNVANAKSLSQQQQAGLYESEVKSLRALMASYEMEFSFGKKGMKQSDKSIDELNVRLVADLRNELDTLRTDAKKLLQRAESTENNTAPNKDMEQKIEQLIDEKKRMQNTLNTLHSQLTSFQKVAGIDYIPSETKVLHMKYNPTFDRIRPSVAVTSSSVANSENNNSNATTGSKVVIDNLNTSHSTNTTIGLDSSKMNQRLKEMFKERITSFREAVYLLTGFRVDLYTPESNPDCGRYPQLRLKSMYSDDPSDCLTFQWRGEILELIETPFTRKLDPDLLSYLSRSNSVPAFTSSVTLDLFEKQTFMG